MHFDLGKRHQEQWHKQTTISGTMASADNDIRNNGILEQRHQEPPQQWTSTSGTMASGTMASGDNDIWNKCIRGQRHQPQEHWHQGTTT